MSNVSPPPPAPPSGGTPPSANGQKVPVSIQDEMRTSYLDYAMSVIVGRAIPDARDGLKPVHRRILYSAHEQGLVPTAAYRKSATIVGDVLGKYHPHGDASVYDAMVRLAQDFSMRYPLIDGQGNYGSIDGDPAAAYRYTEARLSKIAVELLTDIEKECVDWAPNFDDSREEPTVLPSRIPNLLVNGSGGIAVGMATNIPPHNLGEVIDATIHLIRNPDCPIDDLMRLVPGPDFPTGGLIFGRAGIEAAQRTGRGNIIMRARMEVEKAPGKGDREMIVVTEIPYQTNKAKIHARIGELMREKKIEGIAEARDESDRDLMRLVPGPDFPTGGIIFGRGGIEAAQRTGRGNIVMRARVEVEKAPGRGDREQIVVTEIPYQTNKAKIHARIGELMREKKIEGIAEARDESDRDGIRLVIELKKDVVPQVVINQLYRLTELQTSFGVINLAIVRGRPAVLDLKETLSVFVEHRRDVVTRRTRYELRQAEAHREIVEGLGMATTEVDLVVKTIRESRDTETAREALMKLPLKGLEAFVKRAGRPESEIAEAKAKGDYFLSERQAKAILDMRLAKLTGLEQEKLAQEYGDLCNEIARLRNILANESVLLDVIVMELEEIKAKYGDKRKTEIVENASEILDEDLIQEEDMVVTISHAGYIKRTHPSAYRAQKRGGKGKIGMEAREEDWVTQLFVASTHAYVFFFSDRGKVYVKKVFEIPVAARNAKGRAIVNFVGMEPGEKVAAIVEVPKIEEGKYVVTLTKRGQIKKTAVTEYENFRQKGIIGVKVEDGDQLLAAALTDGKRELLVATKQGQSIRFSEEQVRPMGRGTVGVKAMDVAEDDQVVGLVVTDPERQHVLAVCEKGYGKRTLLEEFRMQNRGGKGIILIDASERNGPVVDVKLVKDTDEVMLITDKGQTLRTSVAEIRETGRNAQGVKIMTVGEEERVVAVERLAESSTDGEGSGASEMPPPNDGNGSGTSTPPSMPPPDDLN